MPLTLAQRTLQSSAVYVRIWNSPAHPNMDHISIEIPLGERYIALWPQQTDNPFKDHLSDADKFQMKYKAEKNPADLTFCFYTLEWDAMTGTFAKLKDSHPNWGPFGGQCPSGGSENYVSVAWKMLEAGNIDTLLRSKKPEPGLFSLGLASFSFLFASMVKSPTVKAPFDSDVIDETSLPCDNPKTLIKYLQTAKTNELEKKPDTKTITYECEGEKEWLPGSATNLDAAKAAAAATKK